MKSFNGDKKLILEKCFRWKLFFNGQVSIIRIKSVRSCCVGIYSSDESRTVGMPEKTGRHIHLRFFAVYAGLGYLVTKFFLRAEITAFQQYRSAVCVSIHDRKWLKHFSHVKGDRFWKMRESFCIYDALANFTIFVMTPINTPITYHQFIVRYNVTFCFHHADAVVQIHITLRMYECYNTTNGKHIKKNFKLKFVKNYVLTDLDVKINFFWWSKNHWRNIWKHKICCFINFHCIQ